MKIGIAAIALFASATAAQATIRYEFTALSSRPVEFLQGPETVTGSFVLIVPNFIVPDRTFQPADLVSCSATGSVSGALDCDEQAFSNTLSPPFGAVMFGVFGERINYFFDSSNFGQTGTFNSILLSDQQATLTITDLPAAFIPEPATWAMLISGFGLVGAAARRKAIAARP